MIICYLFSEYTVLYGVLTRADLLCALQLHYELFCDFAVTVRSSLTARRASVET